MALRKQRIGSKHCGWVCDPALPEYQFFVSYETPVALHHAKQNVVYVSEEARDFSKTTTRHLCELPTGIERREISQYMLWVKYDQMCERAGMGRPSF